MTGVQTATIDPPKRTPWVAIAGGVVVVAVAGWFALGPAGAPDGPWRSTAPLPATSTCKVDKGAGAVPDVVATDCHPAELAEQGVLPEPFLRIPASEVSMTRTHGDEASLSIRYEGAAVDQALLERLMNDMGGDDGAFERADALDLPSWWRATTAWQPSWPLPVGATGTLLWSQSPAGDLSCHEGDAAGAMVFWDEEVLIVHRWRERRVCLWKQMQRGKRSWGRGFGGGI